MNIVEKCIAWNAARYDQELDIDLAVNLLTEETEELFDAGSDKVAALDAIGDIVFVAIGVLWKAGMPDYVIEQILGITRDLETNVPLDTYMDKSNTKMLFTSYPFALASVSEFSDSWTQFAAMNAALLAIYGVVLPRLINMGMEDAFYDIANAICDSNNTKVIKGKTDPSVKANIDKGSSFVPPTLALQRILGRYEVIQTTN